MKMMRVNDVTLHMSDTGQTERPALVFSNSLGTDFRLWDRVAPAFSGHFRIVRYDKRGHGLSEAPPPPYAMSDHVGDLEALLDRLDIRDAIVAGLSVGGMIAQGLAAKRPDLVRALVLADTAARIGTRDLWNERIAKVEHGGIEAIAENVLERWFSEEFRNQHPEEVQGWRAMVTRTPVNGYAGTSFALRDTDYSVPTSHLKLPVLCLGGSEDGSTPPAVVKATADLIPGARFVEIPDAGHLPCIDQPAAMIDAMQAFFQEARLV
ncbi:3-oxoadipate enol-lactonase [Roseibium aquae]|uniref:3-oxoadipate enol-lactonase n=1 Tax=Roseibium aquae TaxID=1323746 RepID=A0A916WZI0_9HYPH|nr:3-oxoadipate enol-lactonase [Roseibium aquae]GGB42834.1 3-oxoadipate enol-lactonase [Roseibium aquae]